MRSKLLKMAALGLALSLCFALPALAKSEKVRTAGTVTAIDLAGQNFSIADRNNNLTKIFVNPATEFEIEKGKGFWGDDDVPFTDLQVGDWVKVKSQRVNGELEAKDVDIYREK